MKKTKILTNKSICLENSILEVSKILMYDFWYDYAKTKICEKVKLCHLDTVSLYTYKQMIFIKTLQKMLKLDLILQIMN